MNSEYELNVMRTIQYLERNVEAYNKNSLLTGKLKAYGFNLLSNGKCTEEELKTLKEALKVLKINNFIR